MNRRNFLAGVLALPVVILTKPRRFRFRIKTKDKSIISVTIEGKDEENAKYKLRQRYPDCEILEMKEL